MPVSLIRLGEAAPFWNAGDFSNPDSTGLIKNVNISLAIGPQYSINRGVHPSLIQSPNITAGYGLVAEWSFQSKHSIELGFNTVNRSFQLNSGSFSRSIDQLSLQAQLLYRFQLYEQFNLGIGAHIDTVAEYYYSEYGYIRLPADGSFNSGYSQIYATRPNYGVTLSIRYLPPLESYILKTFIDLRYLYSLKNIADGLWANQAIDPKASVLQLLFGVKIL